jgi:DNA-nicking Smr family endonuclease
MAQKRPPGPTPPAVARSLREQVKALVPQLPSKQKPGAPVAPKPKPAVKEGPSFHELASGVKRLTTEPQRPAVVGAPQPAPTHRAAPKRRLWVEQAAGVVRARAEDVPPRWLDDLEAGRVVPRREIDLHRKSAAEARQALEDGIRAARREGVGCLLVLCGRGKHSAADGPVLPDVAVQCLSEELADELIAFATAPRKWGGLGALIVQLRPPSRPSRDPKRGG